MAELSFAEILVPYEYLEILVAPIQWQCFCCFRCLALVQIQPWVLRLSLLELCITQVTICRWNTYMTRVFLIQLQTDMLTMQVCVPLVPVKLLSCLFILVVIMHNFSVFYFGQDLSHLLDGVKTLIIGGQMVNISN